MAGGRMRVLVGVRCLKHRKAGIGHHTVELVEALRALKIDNPSENDQAHGLEKVGTFPGPILLEGVRGWYEYAPALKRRLCSFFGRSPKQNPTQIPVENAKSCLRAPTEDVENQGLTIQPTSDEVEDQTRRQRAPWLFRQGARLAKGFYSRQLRATFTTANFDLYHEPNYFPVPCELPTIVTIHDLSAILHPEWHPAERVRMHEELFDRLIPSKTHFLTVSQHVKTQMWQHLGISEERIHVSHNGVRSNLAPLASEKLAKGLSRLKLKPGYFLHVGTIEPRKNLALLMRAWEDLPAEIRDRHPLVLAGAFGWKDRQEIGLIDRLKDKGLVHLGYVPERDLAALYGGAQALAFPSHDEGFGMPVVEMLSCGGAVLAAPAGAVGEIAGPGVNLIRSGEVSDWRRALCRAATDLEYLAGLKRRSRETAAPYTWEACAKQTLRAYQALLKTTSRPANKKLLAGNAA